MKTARCSWMLVLGCAISLSLPAQSDCDDSQTCDENSAESDSVIRDDDEWSDQEADAPVDDATGEFDDAQADVFTEEADADFAEDQRDDQAVEEPVAAPADGAASEPWQDADVDAALDQADFLDSDDVSAAAERPADSEPLLVPPAPGDENDVDESPSAPPVTTPAAPAPTNTGRPNSFGPSRAAGSRRIMITGLRNQHHGATVDPGHGSEDAEELVSRFGTARCEMQADPVFGGKLHTGVAYCTFEDAQAAQEAAGALNGTAFGGYPIRASLIRE